MMLRKTGNSTILILVSTTFQDANIHITEDFKPPVAGTVLKHSAVGSHTLPPAHSALAVPLWWTGGYWVNL